MGKGAKNINRIDSPGEFPPNGTEIILNKEPVSVRAGINR